MFANRLRILSHSFPFSSRTIKGKKPGFLIWCRASELSIVLGVALVSHSQAAPQWIQDTVAGPVARYSTSMAYDSGRGNTVMFGGQTGNGPLADTWTWSGSVWKLVSTAGPAARDGASMVYDSIRGKAVLFGGRNGSSYTSDTWEWDGSSWNQVGAIGPSARANASMAFDSARGITILFGGVIGNSSFADTWEWDGTTWKQAATDGPLGAVSMAYDSALGKTVLFGAATSTTFNDTWTWDGATWTQVSTNGPSGGDSIVYDSVRDRIVLFASTSIHSSTWEWNGSTWVLAATSGPAGRSRVSLAFDSNRGKTVLFGGSLLDFGPTVSDTWEWDGSVWRQGPSLAARANASMAYDSARDRTVLFGGTDNLSTTDLPSLHGDTWEWGGGSWLQVATTGPTARDGASMVYDTTRGKVVLFGGFDGKAELADTWEWNGTAWQSVTASGPTGRAAAAASFDTARGRTVLFGGNGSGGNQADTWEWDGSVWNLMATTGPSARSGASMVYDSARGKTVLFGGVAINLLTSSQNYLHDTWEWDGITWKQVATSGPSGRTGACMTFDAAQGKAVVFGGYDSYYDRMSSRWISDNDGDTWQWDGSAWKQMSNQGPSARHDAAAAYDSARGKTILFGGVYSTSGSLSSSGVVYDYGDTWEYGVFHVFTMADAAAALSIDAGLTTASLEAAKTLDIESAGPSAGRVDIADAVRIARKVAGLDANP